MNTRWWLALLAALLVSALTARLGFWQLDRAAQKTAIQRALDLQRQQPPLQNAELPRNAQQAAQHVHRRVQLQGRWLGQHTVYLDNRPMAGRTGFFALTPLQLDDGNVLLVQRGWLPRDMQDRTRITAQPAPSGSVALQGRIALTASRLFEFEGAATGAIRQNLDLAQFAKETQLPLLPFVVVQDGDAPDGLKRDWTPPATGVDKHHGYAFQWFALSALSMGLFAWYQFQRSKRQRMANNKPAHEQT